MHPEMVGDKALENSEVASNESESKSPRKEHLWKDLKIAVARRHPSNLRDLEHFEKFQLRGVGNLLMVVGSDWFRLFSPKGVQPNIKLRLPMILSDPIFEFYVK